ncbi:hypothetical protein FRC14_006425 [Serendipita sp. 396]|nr:hypothetical protein FRC14_006425 [Serendipita sp. 396]
MRHERELKVRPDFERETRIGSGLGSRGIACLKSGPMMVCFWFEGVIVPSSSGMQAGRGQGKKLGRIAPSSLISEMVLRIQSQSPCTSTPSLPFPPARPRPPTLAFNPKRRCTCSSFEKKNPRK